MMTGLAVLLAVICVAQFYVIQHFAERVERAETERDAARDDRAALIGQSAEPFAPAAFSWNGSKPFQCPDGLNLEKN